MIVSSWNGPITNIYTNTLTNMAVQSNAFDRIYWRFLFFLSLSPLTFPITKSPNAVCIRHCFVWGLDFLCALPNVSVFVCFVVIIIAFSRSYSSNNMNEWMNWRRRLQFSEQIVLNVFCYLLKVQRLRCISWIWRHWKFTFTDLRFHSSCYYSFDRCSVFPQMTLTTLWMSIELLFCVFVFSFSLYAWRYNLHSNLRCSIFTTLND